MAKSSGGTRQKTNNTSTESNIKNEFRKDVLNSKGIANMERTLEYYKRLKRTFAKDIKELYKEAIDTVKDTVGKLNLESVYGVNTIDAYYIEQLSSLNLKISDKISVIKYNADRGYANKMRSQDAVDELYSLKIYIDDVGKEISSNKNLLKLNEILIKKDKWKQNTTY